MAWARYGRSFWGESLGKGSLAVDPDNAKELLLIRATKVGDLSWLTSTVALLLPKTLVDVAGLCLPPNLEELRIEAEEGSVQLRALQAARRLPVRRLVFCLDPQETGGMIGAVNEVLACMTCLEDLKIGAFPLTYRAVSAVVVVPVRVKHLQLFRVPGRLADGDVALESVRLDCSRGEFPGDGFDYGRLKRLRSVTFDHRSCVSSWITLVPGIVEYTGSGLGVLWLWRMPNVSSVIWNSCHKDPPVVEVLLAVAATQHRVVFTSETPSDVLDDIVCSAFGPDSPASAQLRNRGLPIPTKDTVNCAQTAVDLLRMARRGDCPLRALCLEAAVARRLVEGMPARLALLPAHLRAEVAALSVVPDY